MMALMHYFGGCVLVKLGAEACAPLSPGYQPTPLLVMTSASHIINSAYGFILFCFAMIMII